MMLFDLRLQKAKEVTIGTDFFDEILRNIHTMFCAVETCHKVEIYSAFVVPATGTTRALVAVSEC
jgi:hypothetical protein